MKKLLLAALLVVTAPAFSQSPALSNAAKLNTIKSVNDPLFNARCNGTTDDTTAITNALSTYWPSIRLPSGDCLVTSLTNTRGTLFEGSGRIVKAITGGNQQLNTYAGTRPYIEGREYLSAFHKNLIARIASSIVFSGDSTTAGTGVTSPYLIHELIREQARTRGLYMVTTTNSGHSGESTVEWLASRLAADIALSPNLYIIRWGINDPYTGGSNLTAAQSVTNMRTGLATWRAARTLSQASCLVMTPNSTSDTPQARDEKFYEAIALGYRQAARDFKCAFADTYAYLYDSRANGAAGDYMDDPYGDGRRIHPANVMNMWIAGLIGDAIFPKGIEQIAENGVRNVTGSTITKIAADLPTTYEKGVTIYRANPGGGGAAWPYDGAVITINHADGTQYQINWSYNDGTSGFATRTGQSNVWQAWQQFGNSNLASWTPTVCGSSTAGVNTYSGQGGHYMVNGNTVTVHFRITMTAKDAAMAGSVGICGLPFTENASATNMSGSISRFSNVTLTGGYTQVGIHTTSGTSTQFVQSGTGVATAAIAAAAIAANSEFFGTLTYFK